MKMNRGIRTAAAWAAVGSVLMFATAAEARPHPCGPPPMHHHHHHHGPPPPPCFDALFLPALAVGFFTAVASAAKPAPAPVVVQQPVACQPAPVAVAVPQPVATEGYCQYAGL